MEKVGNKEITLEEIRKLPKTELHGHLDGYLEPDDILAIAQKNKRKVVTMDGKVLGSRAEIMEFWKGDGYQNVLLQVLNRFSPVTGLMQTKETIRDVAYTYVQKLAKENIIYAETRFAPQYHTKEGLSMEEVVGSALEGLAQGEKETGVTARLIICIGREVGEAESVKIAEAALEFAGRGVVALDLACNEHDFPPELHKKAYELTFNSKLKRTVHAGEACLDEKTNIKNIYTAINALRADGLGHAIPLVKDEKLMKLVKEKKIRVESNPISNLILGYISDIKELQLDKLLKAGILVSINSDDPAMWSKGTLSENLYEVAKAYGFGLKELKKLIGNGIESAFISEQEKGKLRKKLEGSWPAG